MLVAARAEDCRCLSAPRAAEGQAAGRIGHRIAEISWAVILATNERPHRANRPSPTPTKAPLAAPSRSFLDDQGSGQHVVKRLFLSGEASHQVADHEEHRREYLAPVPAVGPAE